MAPLWHESFGEWSGVQRELNRILDAARQTVDAVVGHFTWPAINTWESAEEFFVTAEAPGLDVPDFDLSVANQTLVLRCARKPFAQPDGARVVRNERADGKFERAVVLPGTVDTASITARYDRGVLVVRMPKVASARPRKIDIREG